MPSRDEEGDRFEQRLRRELTEQHRKLRLKAMAIFAALKGRPGIRSEEHLAQILAKVTGDYESGKFLPPSYRRNGARPVLRSPDVAGRSWPRFQQPIVCLRNAVISVTLPTLRPVVLFEGLFVFAAIKQAGVASVAKTAALMDAGESGRHRRMMSVTIVACRRGEIPALQNGAAVNADAVFRQLIDRQR